MLKFYYGVMGSMKSVQAMSLAYEHKEAGRNVLLLTTKDRSGKEEITSRLGVSSKCQVINESTSLPALIVQSNPKPDTIIVDESQFMTSNQVLDLGYIVDTWKIDAYCFGLLTDFRAEFFPASAALVAHSDTIYPMQSEALCWCGAPARYNARLFDGEVVFQGPQIVVGDDIYRVLCRKHWRSGDLGNGKS